MNKADIVKSLNQVKDKNKGLFVNFITENSIFEIFKVAVENEVLEISSDCHIHNKITVQDFLNQVESSEFQDVVVYCFYDEFELIKIQELDDFVELQVVEVEQF
jgi:hypothetical protein